MRSPGLRLSREVWEPYGICLHTRIGPHEVSAQTLKVVLRVNAQDSKQGYRFLQELYERAVLVSGIEGCWIVKKTPLLIKKIRPLDPKTAVRQLRAEFDLWHTLAPVVDHTVRDILM